MINVASRGLVQVIELARPERRNALDIEHCQALKEAVEAAAADGARAVVISGAGTTFCSGADFGQVYGAEFRGANYAMLRSITEVTVPVIAAVNGPAIGAGTQLAIACDLRMATETAVFAVPTARIGLAADPWTIRRLALIAGGGTARAVLLACEEITAQIALTRGLVDRIGGQDDAVRWAESIAELAPLTVAYYKRGFNTLFEPEVVDEGLRRAVEACWASEDVAEGQRARAERRAPRFRGR